MAVILSFITQKYDFSLVRVNGRFITQKHDFRIKLKFYNRGSWSCVLGKVSLGVTRSAHVRSGQLKQVMLGYVRLE